MSTSLLKQNDLSKQVKDFHNKVKNEHRYASFDYCYNFFKNSTADEIANDYEKACLHLSSYLASWGMYRGSSFLLQEKSMYHYMPIIKYIEETKRKKSNIWNIDVNNYTPKNIDLILETYEGIKKLLELGERADLTLITKIMLGVFSCVPAFDTLFKTSMSDIFRKASQNSTIKYCGFSNLSKKSLTAISSFYNANQQEIDILCQKITTITFDNTKSNINYNKAKIIDMYGFTKSLK